MVPARFVHGYSLLFETIARLTGVPWTRQGPVFLVSLGHGTTHWIAAFFYLLLPFIGPDLGLSYTDTGFLVSVFHLSSLAANLGSGLAVDISGRRILFQIIALCVGGAALLAFGFTDHFVVLAGLVALLGASNNLWHPPAIAYLSESYPKNRGYVLSIHAFCANLGDTLAPPVAGALLTILTWQRTSFVSALPVFLVVLVLALTLLHKDRETKRSIKGPVNFREYATSIKNILRNRVVVGLCLASGCRNIAQNGLYLFLPLYLINELRTGAIWMGLVMMSLQIGGLVASPIAGTWSDRVGRRPVILWGLVFSACIVALIAPLRGDLAIITVVALAGFFLFAIRPVVHSWMMDLSPPGYFGSSTSILFGTQAIMTAAIMPVGGMIADRYGLAMVFYFLAATVLIASFIVFLLPTQNSHGNSRN